MVRLFDGERTVRAVVLESSLPESLVLQVTNRLYASGALLPARVARARGLEPRARPGPHRLGRPAAPDVHAGGAVVHRAHPRAEPRARPHRRRGRPGGDGRSDRRGPSATGAAPVDLPGVSGWDGAPGVGEMERALRSVPLGLEPFRRPRPGAVPTPPAVARGATDDAGAGRGPAAAPPAAHAPQRPGGARGGRGVAAGGGRAPGRARAVLGRGVLAAGPRSPGSGCCSWRSSARRLGPLGRPATRPSPGVRPSSLGPVDRDRGGPAAGPGGGAH